jgi:hypothetical protein
LQLSFGVRPQQRVDTVRYQWARSWFLALLCFAPFIPWQRSVAQRSPRMPDVRAPRVVITASDDSAPGLAQLIVETAQHRRSRVATPRRLWVVSMRDIDQTLTTGEDPRRPGSYGELAQLVRAVSAVVVTARGRADSLRVVAIMEFARKQPADTLRFDARSPQAAVDSLLRRLLADARFRRGAS